MKGPRAVGCAGCEGAFGILRVPTFKEADVRVPEYSPHELNKVWISKERDGQLTEHHNMLDMRDVLRNQESFISNHLCVAMVVQLL